jgi:hypothetical protein
VWLPTYHFERLLEEACPNHVYPIKHKLRDCGMMKNFMVLGSLTQGMELDDDDVTPFPGEDGLMTIYDGSPLPEMRHVSNLSPGTLTTMAGGAGTQECKDTSFLISLYINVMCICI